jgi:hypothetical protein
MLEVIKKFTVKNFTLIITTLYLAVILITYSYHEFWRDEVRALSLAISPDSFLGLTDSIKNEGHPILWFAFLRFLFILLNTPFVLPTASIIISIISIIIFLRYSPFSKLVKFLFTFSILPIYEYSIMARNYGISMLLIFIFACLYKNKDKYSWILAICIGLLANTNAHSIFIAFGIIFIWLIDDIKNKDNNLDFKKLIFLLSLVIFSALTIVPTHENIIIDVSKKNYLDFKDVANYFVTTLPPWHVIDGIFPREIFYSSTLLKLITFITFSGLLFSLRKDKAKFISLLFVTASFAYLFKFLYPGGLRHMGLILIFVLAIYWIKIDSDISNKINCTNSKLIVKTLLPIILIFGVYMGYEHVKAEILYEKSSSKKLAQFLKKENLHNIILICEPDYLIEALPFYMPRVKIFIPREDKYSNYVSWTTASRATLSLDDLVNKAIHLKNSEKKDIYILLGFNESQLNGNNNIHYSYNKTLLLNGGSFESFKGKTIFIEDFTKAINDENFALFKLK